MLIERKPVELQFIIMQVLAALLIRTLMLRCRVTRTGPVADTVSTWLIGGPLRFHYLRIWRAMIGGGRQDR